MDELTQLSVSGQASATSPEREPTSPAYVIGIVAAADQLWTLKSFFDAMPVDAGVAVVIMHPSSPDTTHVTREILSSYTRLPIHDGVVDTPVERNSVYLILPKLELRVAGGKLVPIERHAGEQRTRCVDILFDSLVEEFGERAVGVVLSTKTSDDARLVLVNATPNGSATNAHEMAGTDLWPTDSRERRLVNLLVPPSRIAEIVLSYAKCLPASHGASHRADQGAMPFAASNAELVSVLDAATQVSICATDINGMITLFNSGAENMLGYKSSEMVGRQTPEIMHLESEVKARGEELSRELGRDISGFEVFVAYANAGRFERREWTYVRKDGHHLTVNLVVTAVRNSAGEITGFLGVAEDISERKKSEAALRKSEERFNLAVAGSNDGLWDWDIRTNEVYYSPRFKELLGYRDDEFENVFASFETRLHPHDREPTLASVRRHLRDREPYDVEYRLRTKGGEYRWFRARGQAIWNDAGRAVRMAGSLTDLTKRKHAEAALERTAVEVQNANQTLRIAEADARRAVVQRDQFLAMLSHELRNPLSAILNGLGVLEHADADRDVVDGAHQAIRRQAYQMSRLLDDLLDVARITQGKIDFRKEVLDLNNLIREAAQATQPAMEARRQHLTVIPATEPVLVEGDPTRLLQIVENLLTNAAKYTPPGGEVSLELKQDGANCELCVRDNGRGIEPHMLDEIFDMFVQSDHALDRSDGGMGVGLTLVRTLVSMHNGTVTAHSAGLGQGSAFVMRLPLTANAPAQSAEPTSLATAPAATRVLLVEDNPDTRDMLQALLKLDGFAVEVAADGQQGLDAILAQRPDVALIDIGLPILNGYEVARRVRSQLSASEVQLVALTGYGQAKDRKAVFQAGFDEHLVKPINPQELVRFLNTPRKPR